MPQPKSKRVSGNASQSRWQGDTLKHTSQPKNQRREGHDRSQSEQVNLSQRPRREEQRKVISTMSSRWATATAAEPEEEEDDFYIEGESDDEVIATDDEEESDWSEDEDEETQGKGKGKSASAVEGEGKGAGARNAAGAGKGQSKSRRQQQREDLEMAKRMHTDDLESDDEADGNTIGNVPLAWYDDFDHIGYDLAGKKIAKRAVQGDGLDRFLKSKDDPNFRRTIYDEYNQREVSCSRFHFVDSF